MKAQDGQRNDDSIRSYAAIWNGTVDSLIIKLIVSRGIEGSMAELVKNIGLTVRHLASLHSRSQGILCNSIKNLFRDCYQQE